MPLNTPSVASPGDDLPPKADDLSDRRPRLTPAMADIRRAVRATLSEFLPGDGSAPVAAEEPAGAEPAGAEPAGAEPAQASGRTASSSGKPSSGKPVVRVVTRPRNQEEPTDPSASQIDHAAGAENAPLVLVALSGGADSLALAAATAFEAARGGLGAGAVIIDHALQPGSAAVAAAAAAQASALGLDPVVVRRVSVADAPDQAAGPEAVARDTRYRALEAVRQETGAVAVLLGHTLDDQAETVLLGLARGSGPTSLHGMPASRDALRRPLLGIRRETTRAACADAGLEPWEDPHNSDRGYTRVRVRESVLPVLEAEIGPGVAAALARTAEQLREDSSALDRMVEETIEEIVEHAEAGISVSVAALVANPAALRNRIIRHVVQSEFGVALSRSHTLAAAALVTNWHGQKGVDLPGIRVVRNAGRLIFTAA